MSFITAMQIELMKIRRSKILAILAAPCILVIIPGMLSIGGYLKDQPDHAWEMMFVQSTLMYAYYLMPLSAIIICTLMMQSEYGSRAIIKTLTLPVSRKRVGMAKLVTVILLTAAEQIMYFILFLIAGIITNTAQHLDVVTPLGYLLLWSLKLFIMSIPMVMIFWMINVLIVKPLLTVSVSLFFVLPGIFLSNTPVWWIYPFNYSGYLVSCELGRLSGGPAVFKMFPFLILAILFTALGIFVSVQKFGRKSLE